MRTCWHRVVSEKTAEERPVCPPEQSAAAVKTTLLQVIDKNNEPHLEFNNAKLGYYPSQQSGGRRAKELVPAWQVTFALKGRIPRLYRRYVNALTNTVIPTGSKRLK